MENLSDSEPVLYFVIFGSIRGISGTPLRIKKWIKAAEQLNIPFESITFDSMPEEEIIEYLESRVRSIDMLFTLNHHGIFRLRRIIKTKNPRVFVDIHALQSVEIMNDFVLKLKYKALEHYANYIILKNRVVTITVCHSLATLNLLNLLGRNHVVQGGLVKFNSKKTKDLEIDLKLKTLTYVGNSREYQGISYLTEKLTSENFLKINQMKLLTIIDNTLTIYKDNSIQKVLDVDQYQTEWLMCNSDLLIIPRLEGKISRFSFPSKVYDYLSSGAIVIASEAFEKLPVELERSLNRYSLRSDSDILKIVKVFLKTAKSNECKDPEIFEALYSRYSWEAQFKQILYNSRG